MTSNYWVDPAIFLIDTLFSLYIFALSLRFLFQWVDADYYNPISQFLIKITHPPLRPLRRAIPPVGRVDTASLLLMFALQTLSNALIFWLSGTPTTLAALGVWTVIDLVELFLNLFFFAILLRAVLSWVGPTGYNAAASLLHSLTEPMLRSSRRLLPPMGGIDLSPLIPLVGLQLAKMLVIPPLQQLASLLN